MALIPVTYGKRAESADVNQIFGLLKGTALYGDNVLLTQYDSTSNYVLKIQPLDATNGKALDIYDSVGTSQFRVNKNHSLARKFVVGNDTSATSMDASPNLFFLADRSAASNTSSPFASIEYANSSGTVGDVGTLRVMCWETGVANNSTRAMEIHTNRTSGVGSYETNCIDLTIQGNVAGTGALFNGLRVRSLSTTWAISGGQRQDCGILIGNDTDGFKYGIRYVAKISESSVELFNVDQDGTIRNRGHHYVLASNTYDLGQLATFWRAVYAGNHLAGNGAAATPTVAGINFLTTGLWWGASDKLGFSTAANERFSIDGTGNVVVGTAALATTATDGFLYIPTCAGPPTGVPTAKTGRVALVYDTVNDKVMLYDGGWIGEILT